MAEVHHRLGPLLAPPSPASARGAAVRRAVRVTLASCAGFYVCRYLLDEPTAGVYALFASIALGALSTVTGAPAVRTRTYVGAGLVGMVLTALGTLLAATTVGAVAGMLVVGFVITFAGVAGPRLAGVAPGLQLFYILPCFPPYVPETLGARLAGIAVGTALLAVADRVLWPAPAPPRVADRIADAAGWVAAYARALGGRLCDGRSDDSSELRRAAEAAADTLRLTSLPVSQRPTGPGRRDHCLTAAAQSIQVVAGRLGALAHLLDQVPHRPHPTTADLLTAAADALDATRDMLQATGRRSGPPDMAAVTALDTVVARYLDQRLRALAVRAGSFGDQRAEVTAASVAEAARTAVLAAAGGHGSVAIAPARTPEQLWFLHASTRQLWTRRIVAHLTPRSVYLQNAVRLALGLALARTVAGVFDLSHGFWVLLATLTLMRTSAAASRAALVPAFAGTFVGAVLAGGLLLLVGGHTMVYALVLPLVMVVAFAAGPLLGPAAGQTGFTVVVAMVFAQLAPATWHLAETRFVDVIIGGALGALIGAAVWPRGGGGEVRRVAAAALRASGDEIVATTGLLGGTAGDTPPSAALRTLHGLFETTFAQFRTEPPRRAPTPNWLVVLGLVGRVLDDSGVLRSRHPAPMALPWPGMGGVLDAAAADVAGAFRVLGDAAADGVPPPAGVAAACAVRLEATPPVADFATHPEAALRVLDAWGWLHVLVADLARAEQALVPRLPANGAATDLDAANERVVAGDRTRNRTGGDG